MAEATGPGFGFAPRSEVAQQAVRERLNRAHAEHMQELRNRFERWRDAPPHPWEDARFQYFGTVGRQPIIGVPGRDYTALASPESSLAWYDMQHVRELEGEDRDAALAALREYESQRRAQVNKIVSTLANLGSAETRTPGTSVVALVDGQLVSVRPEDDPRLLDLLEALDKREADIYERASMLLRGN